MFQTFINTWQARLASCTKLHTLIWRQEYSWSLPTIPSTVTCLDLGSPSGDTNRFLEELNQIQYSGEVYLQAKKFKNKTITDWRKAEDAYRVDLFMQALDGAFLTQGAATSYLPFKSSDTKLYSDLDKEIANKQKQRYWISKFFSKPHFQEELAKIKVAVLDTGISLNHPELNSSVRGTKCCVPHENIVDLYGHGTHCAGIIAGKNCGVAHGVQLYIAKVLNHNGQGDMNWLTDGIAWALTNNVDIISLSLGADKYHEGVYTQIKETLFKDKIVVCAAGNDGSWNRFNTNFPATISGVLRVGSTNSYGRSSDFSSVGGPEIDVAALGENVLSTWPEKKYKMESGTSMATPFVAAMCALLLAYDRARAREMNRQPALKNSHCLKDLLSKLCFNSSLEVAKGRGTAHLEYILDVPEYFDHLLKQIC
jgi:hypothetical protein